MESKKDSVSKRRPKQSTISNLTPMVETSSVPNPSPMDEKKEKLKKMIQSTSQLQSQTSDMEKERRKHKRELEQVKKELGSMLMSSSIPKVQFGDQYFETCMRKKVPRTMVSDIMAAVETLFGKEKAKEVSDKIFELNKAKYADDYDIRFKTHVSSKTLRKDEFFRIK
jgi:hypothetical protein